MSKFLPILFDWVLANVILPFIHMITDKAKMKEVVEKDHKIVEELKNAKSTTDIDSAIDNLP